MYARRAVQTLKKEGYRTLFDTTVAEIKKERMQRLEQEVAKERKAELKRLQDANAVALEALKQSISACQEEVIHRNNIPPSFFQLLLIILLLFHSCIPLFFQNKSLESDKKKLLLEVKNLKEALQGDIERMERAAKREALKQCKAECQDAYQQKLESLEKQVEDLKFEVSALVNFH